MVRSLSPALRRLEQHVEARLDLALADVLVERPRAQRPLHDDLVGFGGAGREEAEAVVGHRRKSSRIQSIWYGCSNRSGDHSHAWSKVTLAKATSTSVSQSLAFGKTYRYRVRGVDKLGHVGAWSYGKPFVARLVQPGSRSIKSAWQWTKQSTSKASGGSLKYQRYSGADFTFTFTGTSVGWVAVKGPTRVDNAYVLVDGAYIGHDLNLHARTTSYRRIVLARNLGVDGRHTLYVHDVGRVGHSRIDIDAMVVLDPL